MLGIIGMPIIAFCSWSSVHLQVQFLARAKLFQTNKTKSKGVPASPTVILQRDLTGEDFAEHWSYRSIIGKLNFLEKSTRPDIAYAVHQCARFSANPKASHAAAVRNIVRYLIGTPEQGIVL